MQLFLIQGTAIVILFISSSVNKRGQHKIVREMGGQDYPNCRTLMVEANHCIEEIQQEFRLRVNITKHFLYKPIHETITSMDRWYNLLLISLEET